MNARHTLEQRLYGRVMLDDGDACWGWVGAVNSQGYAQLWDGRQMAQAHRLLYERLVGPIPEGLVIDHLCRNRACVNPDHLEPVTNAENIRRGAAALTHCKHGHEFTPDNTGRTGVHRYCRRCHRRNGRASWRRRQEVAS